ncbi:probable plastid-lipid-associated protein 13, chloroplastic [Humulus lupulus]|uniref:probable plastid-lipid-associated protein 13, chloroplastic n=1 Tax=Humulus lupulus TaxID=3486 RepID=UPI002B418560|nr:probable plastid-lipid-associated protein 13, chloroplastic [Humulus lupulus]
MFPVTDRRSSCLERLNPTPRPTTSPFLEGQWSFEWFGSGSPGLFAAKFISERFPSNLANLSKMDMVIKDGYARVTTNMRVLNSIETKFTLSTKLIIDGPLRMREEYTGGVFETPKVIEETVLEQVKGALGQVANTIHHLPVPVRDAFTGGLRVPLMFGKIFLVLCPGNNYCMGQNPVLSVLTLFTSNVFYHGFSGCQNVKQEMSCDSGGLQANGCDSGDALARVVPAMELRLWESKGGAEGDEDDIVVPLIDLLLQCKGE